MVELVFNKQKTFWSTPINNKDDRLPDIEIKLDSGSPITAISIPTLLQITGESLHSFTDKLGCFLQKCKPALYGGYSDNNTNGLVKGLQFVPYLVKNIVISDVKISSFLFWVDISGFDTESIVNRSTLFGFDYLSMGRKWFDDSDSFHITFDPYSISTDNIEFALTNISDSILEINDVLYRE